MTEVEAAERARVVAIALEWDGTPYRPDVRIKNVAGDCTFVAKVYEEAGVIAPVHIPPYSPSSHLNRASQLYLTKVMEQPRVREIDEVALLPGDLVLYHFGLAFSHAGIVLPPGWPEIIHGDLNAKHIIRAQGNQGNLAAAKAMRFFTLW